MKSKYVHMPSQVAIRMGLKSHLVCCHMENRAENVLRQRGRLTKRKQFCVLLVRDRRQLEQSVHVWGAH